MAQLDLAYDVTNYTPATATPVDANFKRIEEHINRELIERDGTVEMRGQLKLVGDPIAALDAAPKQYVDQVLPVGIILMYVDTTAPAGGRWMICNGTELQTASYPELWNKIGHKFSPEGTPTSRFNLPNLRDRFPMMQGNNTTIGETGGYRDAIVVKHDHGMKNHIHNLNQHTHTINHDHGSIQTSDNGAHRHSQNTDNAVGGDVGSRARGAAADFTGNFGGDEAGEHHHSVNLPMTTGKVSGGPSVNNTEGPSDNTTGEAGTMAGTDRNLPPFLGVQFIIRVK